MAVTRRNIDNDLHFESHPVVKVDYSIALDGRTAGAHYLTQLVAIIDPGVTLQPAHSHHHIEEIVFVLRGQGQIWSGDGVVDICEGDSVLISADTIHTTRNTGDGPLKILCTFSSADYSSEENYLRHGAVEF